jgi:hypothetical protein
LAEWFLRHEDIGVERGMRERDGLQFRIADTGP